MIPKWEVMFLEEIGFCMNNCLGSLGFHLDIEKDVLENQLICVVREKDLLG